MISEHAITETFLAALSMDDDDDVEFPRMDFEPRIPEL